MNSWLSPRILIAFAFAFVGAVFAGQMGGPAERILVVFLAGWLFVFSALSFYNDASLPYESGDAFTLTISGAVDHPGTFSFQEKVTEQEINKKVHFHEGANLKNLKKELDNFSNTEVVIAPKGYKAIFLKGAVKQEGWVVVEEKFRLKDLLIADFLRNDADYAALKKRRLLKNLEEVIVPSTN